MEAPGRGEAGGGGRGERGGPGTGRLRRSSLALATALTLLVSTGAGGCSGGAGPGKGGLSAELPTRATTPGDALLALLPSGAQVVIEIDLDRARDNEVLGPLARALLEQGQAGAGGAAASAARELTALGGLGAAPLAEAHAIVVASYHVGSAEAHTLTLVRTGGDLPALARQLGAVALGEDVLALGPEARVAEVVEREQRRAERAGDPGSSGSASATASISASASATSAPSRAAWPLSSATTELLTLRAQPMPEGATGALLRVTAELPFDAQLALARLTNLDPPPARLALWVDAVDDAALVLWADSGDAREPKTTARLGAALQGALGELAKDPRVAALGLGASLRAAKIERSGSWVKVAVVVGPQRLRRAASRALAWAKLSLPGPASSPPPSSSPTSPASSSAPAASPPPSSPAAPPPPPSPQPPEQP